MTVHGMTWQGIAQWTPLGMFVCTAFPAGAIFGASISASSGAAKGLPTLWLFLLLLPVFNADLIYASSRYWRMAIWPLGLANLAGVAFGYWLLWHDNSRRHPTPPFAPGSWVALEAAGFIVGWLLAVAIVLLRPASVPRLPVED